MPVTVHTAPGNALDRYEESLREGDRGAAQERSTRSRLSMCSSRRAGWT